MSFESKKYDKKDKISLCTFYWKIDRTCILKHTIDTGDHPPTSQLASWVSTQAIFEIERRVKQMLDHGLIAESTSPQALPVILVSKQDVADLSHCMTTNIAKAPGGSKITYQ